MQTAIDTYQQALQAAPSTELFDRYIGFLTEQLQQHLQAATADDKNNTMTAQHPANEPAAAAAAARVLAAFEQAADAGDYIFCAPCARTCCSTTYNCTHGYQRFIQQHVNAYTALLSCV